MLIQLTSRMPCCCLLPNKSGVMIVIVRPFINVFVVDMNSLIITDVRPIPVGKGFRWRVQKDRYGNIFPTGFYDETWFPIISFFSGLHDRNYWVIVWLQSTSRTENTLLGAFYVLYWPLYKRWSDCLVRSLARVYKSCSYYWKHQEHFPGIC